MPWKSLKKVLLLLAFLLIWELLPASGIISRTFLASPSEVFVALIRLLISGELWMHTSISLQRAFTGFSLAAITMIPLGFLMGWYRYAAIVTLALLGLVTNYSLVWLEKTTTIWKEEITIT